MSQQISNMFVSQYKKKTSLLSQQTGKNNGKKVQRRQIKARKNSKTY
jgi:hypothetical protein